MKHSIKQGIKRIAAFGMSFFMAFMPLSGIVPGAMASVAPISGTLLITYDTYIKGDTVKLVKDSVDVEGKNHDNTSKNVTYATLNAGDFTLRAVAIDSTNYVAKIEGTEGTIDSINGSTVTVTDAMLINEATVTDLNLITVTASTIELDVTIKDSDHDINDVTIVPSGVKVGTVDCTLNNQGKWTIPAGVKPDDKIVISFKTTGMSAIAKDTTGLIYLGTDGNGSRSYQYNTTVNDIITTPSISLELDKAETYTVTATNGTITTEPGYWWNGTNAIYKPLEKTTEAGTTENESFTLRVTPNSGYEIDDFKIAGSSLSPSLITKTGTQVTIAKGTNEGNVDVTIGQVPPERPVGTWIGTGWNIGTEDASVIFKTELPIGCTLEYAVMNSANGTPGTWTPHTTGVASSDGKTEYTITVSPQTTAQYIYLRYKRGTKVSETTVSEAIEFDSTAPDLNGNIQLLVGDNEYTDLSNVIINRSQYDTGRILIQIPVKDDESGIDKLEYSTDGGTTFIPESETVTDSGIYQIPYSLTNKCDTLYYRITDKVGNVTTDGGTGDLSLDLTGITFDLTAPTATYSFKQGDAAVEDITKWQTENITLTVTPTDPEGTATGEMTPGSGITSVVVRDGDANLAVTPDGAGSYGCTITGDGIHTLNIIVRDMAGNEFNDTKTVMIDATGVKNPQLTFGSEQTAFYEAVQMSADAESRAGIKTITFEFKDINGTVVQSKTFQDVTGNQAEFTYTEEMGNFDGTVKVTFTDVCGREASCEKAFSFNKDGATIRITANETWSNQDVAVSVDVTDDFTGIASVQFYVDGTLVASQNPATQNHHTGSITVSDTSASVSGTQIEVVVTSKSGKKTHGYATVKIDKQAPGITLGGITDGAIYNVNKALQITVEENIWQAMKLVEITAEKTLDGTTTKMDLGSFEAGSSVAATSRSFSEDGIYTVTVVAEDAAGNRTSKSISFTVDKTAPVVSMTGATENTYSSNPVTIQFQVVESFFETNTVKVTVERKLEGSTYTRTLNFTSTGKISNLANTFSEDGDYTITITATDRAGNVAQTQTLSFTVDCTAPVITLTGTKDYLVTDQSITLNFVVVESYFETNKVQIQGSRRSPDGKTENLTIPGWTNSARASSLSQAFSKDGYYTITITATDKAGNSKQQTIHFTIDTEPPVIGDLSKYDGKYLSYFQLEEDLEDLIFEITVPTVKMTLNGEAYDGKKITEDGKYTLVIEVVDEVGLTASKTVEFVIDNTAPKIIFAGAEDKKTYTEAVNLNISLENENDTILEILINGEPYDLTEGQTSYNLSFSAFGTYEVEVHTIDAAGNENSQTIKFTYAEHKNQALLWVVIGSGVAAVGLGIFLVIRLRLKK